MMLLKAKLGRRQLLKPVKPSVILSQDAKVSCGQLYRTQIDGIENSVG